MNRSTPGLPVHHQLPEFTQTHVHWVGDAIQPSHPLSSPSPPAPSPSQHQGLFQWVNSSHQVPKNWSFNFSISPSNEHPGLITFRMDWVDLLEVQGTLKSLLQHHSSKASIFPRSALFTVQLSHPYMTTGKRLSQFPSLSPTRRENHTGTPQKHWREISHPRNRHNQKCFKLYFLGHHVSLFYSTFMIFSNMAAMLDATNNSS